MRKVLAAGNPQRVPREGLPVAGRLTGGHLWLIKGLLISQCEFVNLLGGGSPCDYTVLQRREWRLLMASPELDKAIEMFRAAKVQAQTLTNVEQFRMWYEELMSDFDVDDDIICERVGAGGVPAEWIYDPKAEEDRVLLYLHGGGYMIGFNEDTPRSAFSTVSGFGSPCPWAGISTGSRELLSCCGGGFGSCLSFALVSGDRSEKDRDWRRLMRGWAHDCYYGIPALFGPTPTRRRGVPTRDGWT